MITADALARELGCTFSDLDDLADDAGPSMLPFDELSNVLADSIREAWSKRTGIDYTQAAQ